MWLYRCAMQRTLIEYIFNKQSISLIILLKFKKSRKRTNLFVKVYILFYFTKLEAIIYLHNCYCFGEFLRKLKTSLISMVAPSSFFKVKFFSASFDRRNKAQNRLYRWCYSGAASYQSSLLYLDQINPDAKLLPLYFYHLKVKVL